MNLNQFSISLFILLFFAPQLNAQHNISANNWSEFQAKLLEEESLKKKQVPKQFKTYQFDFDYIFKQLKKAPQEFADRSEADRMFIEIPMPDGSIQEFEIYKTNLLPPALQAKFPDIQTFGGRGVSNPASSIKLELTTSGLHAQILNSKSGTILIDPIFEKEKNTFISFNKSSVAKTTNFTCHVEDTLDKTIKEESTHSRRVGDCQLRIFKLALACTYEYANFHGGTINSVMSAMVTTMNRVNGIFEKDASIRMEFIDNNDALIFLTQDDPYSNNNGGAMLGENQTTIDNIIGSGNYDIGHVFSTGGGGVAFLNSPCSGNKAGGVTGLGSPVGDTFDVDYVAHEMGHQYGGHHTFNNSCGGNRSNAYAVEPGSASTIMGYAGICTPNVQNNSDDYFHGINIEEMVTFSNNASCPEIVNLNNNAPILEALVNKSIPKSTPFELTAEATDQDGDFMTYCWEQVDTEIAEMPPLAANTGGPLFRSLNPTSAPSRVFPALQDVVNNSNTEWEVLPAVERTMEFLCTVRDNNNSNGCSDEGNIVLSVASNAGPFLVIEPNTNVTWFVGESRSINWDVANTDNAPVNCSEVDILLSIDGGFTYPTVLASNVPNTGASQINVPNLPGNNNRVRIQGVDNVFFDISDSDFRIEIPPTPTFTFSASPNKQTVCSSETSTSFELNFESILNFDEEISLTVNGLPQGANLTFSESSFVPEALITMTIDNIAAISGGVYDLEIIASSASVTNNENIVLEVIESITTPTSLLTPINGTNDTSLNPELSWNANIHGSEYLIEVATSINFDAGSIVFSTTDTKTNTDATGLISGTVYYWRVLASNECETSQLSDTYSFQTALTACQTYENNTPVDIPIANAGIISSVINIPSDVNILDVNVSMEIDHTWVGDLVATFQNPSGSEITLFDRPGAPNNPLGCDRDNLNVSFDDEAILTKQDFEETCETGDYAIAGNFQTHLGNLFYFDNRSAEGDWTLTIDDMVDDDGGSLIKWAVEICSEIPSSELPSSTNNLVLEVEFEGEEAITENYLKFEKESQTAVDIQYTITSMPISGNLKLENTNLELGGIFTQDDINLNKLSYEHGGDAAITDQFTFDVLDSDNAWVWGNTFNIEINQNTLMLSTESSNISCAGLNDGQITLSPMGGTMPYTFSIDGENFQNENTFSNLSAGDYILIVKDVNGFIFESGTISITAPEVISGSLMVNEDDITVNATGGTGSLSYSIDGINFQTENSFLNLQNGSYTITIKDENDCTISLEENIAINNIAATASTVQTINCFGETNGSISVNVEGGFPPLQYSLNGADFQESNFFDNLSAGSYTIIIKDAMDFTSEVIQILDNPDEIIGNVSILDNDLSIMASGGTGTLNYSIDGINYISNNEFLDLANGMYTVYVKDESGCISEFPAVILFNSFSTAVANIIQEVSCFEETNGSISVNASGGTPPLEYSLDGENFQMSNFFDMLPAGDYLITVRDADDFIITTNNLTLSNPDEITGNVSVDVNGIDINASGGTGSLQYSIDGFTFQNETNFANLANGTYTIYVRDEKGCILELEATIAVNSLSIGATLSQDISCHNFNDGIIIVNVGGGAEPYEYSIDGENYQSSQVFENLEAGTYTFSARDADGFIVTTSNPVVISNPDPIVGSLDVADNNVSITASGGFGLLTYSEDGSFYQTSNFFGALNNGEYTFYVKDENDCIIELQTSISFNSLAASFESKDLSCFESSDGSIAIEATGGMPDYTYSLNGGDYQSNSSFENLAAGEYMISIKDADGFTFDLNTIVLSEPDPIVVSNMVTDANIQVTASGGTGMLTYSLDGKNFQNSNEFLNLDNGSYTINVKDENDCLVSTMAVISINGLVASAMISQEVSCYEFMDGSITASIAGGVEPYTYSIDGENFQSNPTFDNLGAGNYNITIKDADGFETITETITIEQPDLLMVSASSTVDIITAMANGGTGNYMYSIDNDNYQVENTFAGLPIGSYTVYVQDENGCIANSEVEVSFNNMMVMATITQQIRCFGEMDGVISIEHAGGTAPFEYSLDAENFQDENVFENLSAGMYMVTVRDANGFTAQTQIVSITEPAQLSMMVIVTDNSLVVDATGGSGILTFSIDGINYQTSNVFTDVPNGTYVVLVKDENDCEISEQAQIAVNSLNGSAVTTQEINCFGELASIEVTATGGQTPFSYSLDGENYQSENIFTNVAPGIYTIYIKDSEDFLLLINNYTITEPDELILNLSSIGNVITASGMGGTGNLLYSLDGITFESGETFGPFTNGTYTVYVQDENGCISQSEIELDGYVEMSLETMVVNVLCNGESTGMVVSEVQGGIAPFTFSINSPNGSFEELPAGEYIITVTDNVGTMTMTMVTVSEPAALVVTTDVNDNNLTIEATGGTGVYQYSIDGGQSYTDENSFSNLEDGVYNIGVMDENGCTNFEEILIGSSAVELVNPTWGLEVFPNPSHDVLFINIDISNSENYNLQLINVLGQEVKEIASLQNSNSIDMSQIPAGNYFLRISDGVETGVVKIVKQ